MNHIALGPETQGGSEKKKNTKISEKLSHQEEGPEKAWISEQQGLGQSLI